MKRHGYSLIELLVYMTVLATVLTGAHEAYYRCERGSRALTRNADDIRRALAAGERWRREIRAAPDEILEHNGNLLVHWPDGYVVYSFTGTTVWRQSGATRTMLLTGVKSSTMRADRRQRVTAWQWEVELTGGSSAARLRPLFTFQAVPERKP